MNLKRDIFGDSPRFAVLIDPDHEKDERLESLLGFLAKDMCDVVLVGGSTSNSDNIDTLIKRIKRATTKPVLLFPGNSFQLSSHADGLLLPSLISGRNPEYLIGKHVESANIIYRSGLPVFSMGYILVDGGQTSAASYMTQTMPIPPGQSNIAAQTALAGQLLGMKCIYLESGSGAAQPTRTEMIEKVKKAINIPLIVGGGIRTKLDIRNAIDAGADMIVVGTVIEERPEQIGELFTAFCDHVAI